MSHEHGHARGRAGRRPAGHRRDFARLNAGPLVRFGMSLPKGLLDPFDQLIRRRGYANRSEALRDLIREHMIRESWEAGEETQLATLTILYDHSCRGLLHRMTELQHHSKARVLCSMHVHVSAAVCLEILVLKGPAKLVRQEADRLIAMRGVLHGELVLAGKAE